MKREKFAPGEYYHIYNRTILNIPEFKDNKNADKLVRGFLVANSTESSRAFDYLRDNKNAEIDEVIGILRKGEKLVDILSYVVMPDHYHLLLKELRNGGITSFIQKCNTSIAKYINIKKRRTGPLFDSRFKSKHIDSNKYLVHVSLYIHLNPLDFIDSPIWRNHRLVNWRLKKEKLLNYPWSSLKRFLGDDFENPVLSGEKIILDQFEKDERDYELLLQEWSEGMLNEIKDIVIEY